MRVVLSRLPDQVLARLRVVRFDDRGHAGTIGYAFRKSGEVTLCALPPRVSLSAVRGVRDPAIYGAVRGSQWPALAVRRFLLYTVVLHEIGHLQVVHDDLGDHDRRRQALEPFAESFAETWRERLWAMPCGHADRAHHAPPEEEVSIAQCGWARSHDLYKRGEAIERSDRSAARELYEEALEAYPWHALALERLGILRYTREDYEGAAETLTRAIEIDRRLWDANLFLAMALGRAGRCEDAWAHFELTERISETREAARLAASKYAEALGEWGYFDEAEDRLRKLVANDPDQELFARDLERVRRFREESASESS